jgi:hypothetical protein
MSSTPWGSEAEGATACGRYVLCGSVWSRATILLAGDVCCASEDRRLRSLAQHRTLPAPDVRRTSGQGCVERDPTASPSLRREEATATPIPSAHGSEREGACAAGARVLSALRVTLADM